MDMDCMLNGHNAKALAKSVQSLSKFGANLFIEADESGLLLRTLNNSRSAIGSYKFNRHFFERFSVETDSVNCKITMKACFNAFRNMKNVEEFEMKTCLEELKLKMEIRYKHEQTKQISISIIDEENIQSSVQCEDATNIITGSNKIFNEISSNFNALEEEITLEIDETAMTVKNYVSGTRVNDKFMRTQFKLSPSEMDIYEIVKPTSITFCLKEFRAFLAFAESINESMTLQFSDAGKPLFVRIKKLDQLEGTLITSTLYPGDITFCDDIRESEKMNRTNVNLNLASKRKTSTTNGSDQPNPKRHIGADESTLTNSTLFDFPDTENERVTVQSVRILPNLSIKSTTETPTDLQIADTNKSSLSVEFYDTEKVPSEDDDCINLSPTARPAVRSIFKRCFQATYLPTQPSPSSQVFVPDSDSDTD